MDLDTQMVTEIYSTQKDQAYALVQNLNPITMTTTEIWKILTNHYENTNMMSIQAIINQLLNIETPLIEEVPRFLAKALSLRDKLAAISLSTQAALECAFRKALSTPSRFKVAMRFF